MISTHFIQPARLSKIHGLELFYNPATFYPRHATISQTRVPQDPMHRRIGREAWGAHVPSPPTQIFTVGQLNMCHEPCVIRAKHI